MRETYTAEIGVREATGNNDGARVEEYLRYCGLGKGHAWCAAFVSWCFGQAGYSQPRNHWSPALFPARRTIWTKEQGLNEQGKSFILDPSVLDRAGTPSAGDIFGIYYPSLRRIGHVGFVDEWKDDYIITVEGNSENAVVRKRRPTSSIHQIANWTTTP